jgi:UDP-GlcNAc:undecaprenyl-phosphate/decaprenyl-phosphate GlcNAc-1-phosphate transferase
MYALILGFVTAFTLTFIAIPVIIRVARERKLYDRPNERSAHLEPTPSLGGVGIFAGAICGIVLWTPLGDFGPLQYVLAGLVLIFLIGILDDILPISPTKKFTGQLLVALILTYKSDIRIDSLYGVFNVFELPEMTAFAFSMIAIVGIINAFNLIDGINGLAGSIGLLACVVFGTWFYLAGASAMAVLSFSLAGAIIAFLKYNVTPAQIFMGDTGSMLIGTVSAILALKFLEMNPLPETPAGIRFQSAPAVAFALLILPIFDTLRVFALRMALGKSPFFPDKTHIHHLLLQAGLSHMQATGLLVFINTLFVAGAIAFDWLGTEKLLLIEVLAILCVIGIFKRLSLRKGAAA